MARRISYLPLLLEDTHLFMAYLGEYKDNGIQFLTKGYPLNWEIPIGILYDLYSVDSEPLEIEVSKCCIKYVRYLDNIHLVYSLS